ncbi:MAG: DNA-3-methyladenine glycosylase 2 family protein [Actinomycetota bacterium]|nr:DNA-3-methyladenine glycosylase 2 family protein [Actinomycetota bacterium]
MTVGRIELEHPVDLRRTIFPLIRGTGDPTARVEGRTVWRAVRTPDGPATIRLKQSAITTIDAEAWGAGAEHAVTVVAPGMVGAFDDPTPFVPRDPVLAEAWRDHRTVLLTRADPFPVLVAAVLEQKVTGIEARAAWRGIVRMTADEAPGDRGLILPPDAERVASLPSWELTRLGVTGMRAATLREVARHPRKIAALGGEPLEEARAWLTRLPGVGPWTVAEVARLALGDPDAVSVGDFHLPNIVAWALAGEVRGDDDRMIELLEPYRGQRGRVQVLLEASGITAPRFGPKLEPRTFV